MKKKIKCKKVEVEDNGKNFFGLTLILFAQIQTGGEVWDTSPPLLLYFIKVPVTFQFTILSLIRPLEYGLMGRVYKLQLKLLH